MEPEIPGNTGNIGRLCVGVGARLHLVHPLGFLIDEHAVRRAGIDHWRFVDLQEHTSIDHFREWARGRRLHLFSSQGRRPYTAILWQEEDVLVFGKESVGLPQDWVREEGGWRIPMASPRMRSLNLSNAASVVTYSALERLRPDLFADAP